MSKRNILKTASLRNARLCDSTENFGHNSVFNVERADLGWNFVENGTMYGVSGGFLFLSATTFSPSLSRASAFLGVDAGEYTKVIVKFKYKNRSQFYSATKGRVYFATNSDPLFTEEKSEEFDVISDDEWHVYSIDMAPVFKWVGFITNLKIVFADGQGVSGDEIFVEYIRIQADNFRFCTENCNQTDTTVELYDAFDDQNLNSEPQNWSTIDTFPADRFVTIERDPESLVNKVVTLVNSTAVGGGPSMFRSLPQQVGQGNFSFRFRLSDLQGIFSLYSDSLGTNAVMELQVDTISGNLQYRQGLATFTDFEVVSTLQTGKWYQVLVDFNLSRRSLVVYLDGQNIGSIPYIFAEPVQSVKISNPGYMANSLSVDDIMIVKVIDTENFCPGIGRKGSIEGTSVGFTKLDIVEGVNDEITVNINNYGNVKFTLPESKGLTREEVRVLIEREISSIDSGGYPHCEVSYDPDQASYRIESGTYGFDSTVEVVPIGSISLAQDLGFLDELGIQTYEVVSGRPHAIGFQFSNTYLAKTLNLSDLVNVGGSIGMLHNPTSSMVKIGTDFAGTTSRLNKLSGVGKTIVDFYHRATEEGYITEVEFHGELPRQPVAKYITSTASIVGTRVDFFEENLRSYELNVGDLLEVDEPGYEGNGSYIITEVDNKDGVVFIDTALVAGSGLSVTVQTVGKVKHLRPDHKGRLTLVNEVVLGEEALGQLYSRVPDTYKIEVNWYVHKGDMIGIYNATGVYVGNDINTKAEAFYIEYQGDLTGESIEVEVPVGNGIKGIGLIGRNPRTQDRAVYDLKFDEAESIEDLTIEGILYPETRAYNLMTAIDQGMSIQVTVTGTHVHKVFNTTLGEYQYIPHNNITYNVGALTDGVTHSYNGFLGSFEQDIEGAVYFYVSGDGEFTPSDPSDTDAIEFPVTGNLIHEQILEYYNDEVRFDLNWNVPKSVDKFKVFFKEYPNVDNYSIEWFKKANKTYDGSTTGYERIGLGNDSEFTLVKLDQLTLTEDQIDESVEFIKHFQKVFDAHIDTSNPEAGGTRLSYERNPFTVMEKSFDPVTTTSFRWICGAHRSTKISEIELYSSTSSSSSLAESLELFFSSDGELFEKADVDVINSGKVKFDIGIPVKYIRIVVTPSTLMELTKLTATASEDLVKYSDEDKQKSVSSLDVDIEKGELSPAKKIKVTNLDCFTSSAEVSVETEELSDTLILKTGLHSEDEVYNPEIGPNGILYSDDGTDLRVTKNIAINAKLYKLRNLASNAPYYEATEFSTESEYFRSGLDFNKWTGHFQNFPGYSAGDTFSPAGIINYGSTFPGFNMESGTFPPDSPGNPEPNKPASAEIRTKWNVTGQFSAFVEGRIDPTGTNAAPRSIVLGLIDATGRKISIEKEVHQWRNHSPQPSVERSFFTVRDTASGTITTLKTFEQGSNPFFGSTDYTEPFVIRMTRSFEGAEEVYKFSYVDSVNGSGELEWDGDNDFEYVNPTPLVEPVKMFLQNYWRIQPYFPGGIDGTLTGTPHNRILSFNFSGQSTYSSNIAFGVKRFCGDNGEVGEDNKQALSASDGIRAIAVDLSERYNLDILVNYTTDNNPLWNPNLVEFSSSDVDNPELVSWGNTSITNTRWILFKEEPVPLSSSGSEVTYLDTLRIYPDITQNAPGRLDNAEWDQIVDVLTDGDSSTALTQIETPIFAIDLGERFQLEDYFLLDRRGEEFGGRPYFEGWGSLTWHTDASTGLNDPKKVNWLNWSEHGSGLKSPRKSRWHAFKNETFDRFSGNSNPRYAATFRAKTLGFTSSGTGEYTDVVDFTEFSQWFATPYVEEIVESEITLDLVETVGLLYDTSEPGSIQGIESGEKYYLFDNDSSTYTAMTEVSGETLFAWRVFGTPSGTILDDSTSIAGITLSGTGTVVESQTVLLEGVEVTAFEVSMGDNTIGIPDQITIQTLSGSDPTQESNWVLLDSENGLVSEVEDPVTNVISLVFNGGETYRYSLNSPITISGFRVLFENIDYGDDQTLRDVSIGSVNAIRRSDGQGADIVEVSNDVSVREGGRRSLKLTYKAGNSEAVTRTLGGAAELSLDPDWSIQDYLKFFLKIDNHELLDLENSFIKIGQDSEFYYAWPLSSLQGDLSSVELNSYRLRFREAAVQGIPGISISSRDRSDLESRVDFKEGPIQFVEIELKPNSTASQDITLWLDNFSIDREKFELPGKFGNALYLNNGELLHYPLANFDIRKGYFEAIVTPDWDYNSNTTVTRWEAFTIFSAINDLDESFSCVYAPFNFGLMFSIGTTDRRYNLTVGEITTIEKYEPFKIAVAWDSKAELLEDNSEASLRVWINDQPFSEFTTTWDITQTKNTYFFIGSKAPETDIALNTAIEFPTTNPGKISPDIFSVTGGIENVLLNREPTRLSYGELETLKDKIQISTDGVLFFEGSSEDLPLIFSDLAPGESFDLWVRTNLPKNTKNMSRTAYLRTRWRRS